MEPRQREDMELEPVAGIQNVASDPHVYHLPHNFSDQSANPRRCSSRAAFQTQVSVIVISSVIVIALSLAALLTSCSKGGDRGSSDLGGERDGVKVVPSLCTPCQSVQDTDGWRTIGREDKEVLCCLFDYQRLACVFSQVYDTEINSKMNNRSLPDKSSAFITDWNLNLGHISDRKPSAHIRVEATNGDIYFKETGSSMQIVNKWQQMERNEVLLRSDSWGIEIPTSGLYCLHSSANFVFNFTQTGETGEKMHAPVWAVHQISRYNARTRLFTVLAQRRQSVSATHNHGMASFVVTFAELQTGDILAVGFSPDAAFSLVECGLGLFMVH